MKVAITGVSAGIGRRAADLFASHGHHVIGFVRDLARGAAALSELTPAARSNVQLVALDLASSASIRSAASAVLNDGPLDALINNAAIFDQAERSVRLSPDGHELFWATNHLGPVELTARLSPALAASASPAVVFVASKGLIAFPRIRIRFDALDGVEWFTPTRAYYHAKLAQVMTALTLAERIGDVVEVSCLRVPAVRLDTQRLAAQPALLRALYAPKNRIADPPERIAAVYEELVLDRRRPRSEGVYLDERLRPVAVPAFAADADSRARLWKLTQTAIGDPVWAWG
jgi:NAD(P)-dependent dehydrogenase (short-subunit alcohol dehydrogenase family)